MTVLLLQAHGRRRQAVSEVEQRKKAFTIGYLAGLCGMPLVIAPAGNPDSNTSLPELPSGLEEYPYRFITKYLTESNYWLFAAELPVSYDKSIPAFVNANGENLHYRFYACFADEGYNRWVYESDFTAPPNKYPGFWTMYPEGPYIPIWSNHDIYYAENYVDTDTVFLRGSGYPGGDNTDGISNIDLLLGCRLGFIVRQQLGGISLPDGVLISSDGYILTDCNGLYLIAAVAAEPDVPDEPGEVATMYLYGTPSESGNIGLRYGDTVTYYNGAVLPDIVTVYPDELQATHPYVFIADSSDKSGFLRYTAYRLFISPVPFVQDDNFDTSVTTSVVDVIGYDSYCYTMHKSETQELNVWSEPKELTFASAFEQPCLWANHKVLDANGGVFHPEVKPIQVGNIVEYINDIPIYEQKEDS